MVVFSHYLHCVIHPKGGDRRISEPSTASWSLSQRMKSQRTSKSSKAQGSCCYLHGSIVILGFSRAAKNSFLKIPEGVVTSCQKEGATFPCEVSGGHEMGPIFLEWWKNMEKPCKFIMVVLRHFPVQRCMKFGLVSYNKPWKTNKNKFPLGEMIQFDGRIFFNWVGSTTNGLVSYKWPRGKFQDPVVLGVFLLNVHRNLPKVDTLSGCFQVKRPTGLVGVWLVLYMHTGFPAFCNSRWLFCGNASNWTSICFKWVDSWIVVFAFFCILSCQFCLKAAFFGGWWINPGFGGWWLPIMEI